MPPTEGKVRAGSRPAAAARILSVLIAAVVVPRVPAAEPAHAEVLSAWRYVQDLVLPPGRSAKLDDFLLPAAVFDGARADLGDLRLYDPSGQEVPYALRVRRPVDQIEAIPAIEFNRSRDPGGASELTLDLGERRGEHNNVEVQMPGANYRRHARLDGGDDGKDWRALQEKDLIHFNVGRQAVDDRRFVYPPSRFRYVRVRVDRDPPVDDDPVAIEAVIVRRRVEVPGEFVERPAGLGPREAVPADGGPGSAWVLDLGGDRVPCDRLTLDVADAEFVRDYHVEAGGPADDPDRPFQPIGAGVWRRRAGEPRAPLVAEFGEVAASRLRLVVTDHRNPPLHPRAATTRAAAREVVFADPGPGVSALRLYHGNPQAEPPRYDFARNLPATLDPPPARLSLASRRENPSYLPAPPPLTERWPWLIYVILGAISLGLGLIIVGLARTAVRVHDARRAAAPAG